MKATRTCARRWEHWVRDVYSPEADDLVPVFGPCDCPGAGSGRKAEGQMLSVAEFSEALVSAQAYGEAWARAEFKSGWDHRTARFRVEDVGELDVDGASALEVGALWNGCSSTQTAALKWTVCAVAEAAHAAMVEAERHAAVVSRART